MDMFEESIEGHKYKTPYQVVKMINPNSKEDMELLREVLRKHEIFLPVRKTKGTGNEKETYGYYQPF